MTELTTKQLCDRLGVSKWTLLTWRSGKYFYKNEPIYYRKDQKGLPQKKQFTAGHRYITYNLKDVYLWVKGWKVVTIRQEDYLKTLKKALHVS